MHIDLVVCLVMKFECRANWASLIFNIFTINSPTTQCPCKMCLSNIMDVFMDSLYWNSPCSTFILRHPWPLSFIILWVRYILNCTKHSIEIQNLQNKFQTVICLSPSHTVVACTTCKNTIQYQLGQKRWKSTCSSM